MVAGMQGGLYAAANTWWSTAWYAKTEKGKFRFLTIGASGIRWINLVIFIVATLKANGRMTSFSDDEV